MGERSLEAELERMREMSDARVTPEQAARQAEAIAEVDRLVAWCALGTGATAPDFTLRSASDDRDVSLNGLLGNGPVVLSFYRGQWCPYCSAEVRAVEERYPDIKELGAEVLFIGAETRENAAKLIEKTETNIPVLYDVEGKMMHAYGLTFEVPESLRPMYQRFGLPDANTKTGWRLPSRRPTWSDPTR